MFASEFLEKTMWYPTILGFLVVFFALALFVGLIWLLLGTNLGARLGFLISFTAVTGFGVVLTLLWLTTASPLNTIKGRIPEWKVIEIAKTPADATTAEIRNIEEKGTQVGKAKQADVKAAVDAALITKEEVKAEGPLPEDANKFARFATVNDYTITNTYELGGGIPNPLNFEFKHKPLFAVAGFCAVKDLGQPFYVPPPIKPNCADPSDEHAETGFLVMERDLGSIRVPPMVAFASTTLLFILGLCLLHWREKDEQVAEQRAAGTALAPVPVKV
ncbi:MAG: hypothetical protein EXQ79_01830 [Acidimicrobiia bacterium]|nr:hypothetical protein [Acidimicrobiia bacterium]